MDRFLSTWPLCCDLAWTDVGAATRIRQTPAERETKVRQVALGCPYLADVHKQAE